MRYLQNTCKPDTILVNKEENLNSFIQICVHGKAYCRARTYLQHDS
jgi:hypothetical protein